MAIPTELLQELEVKDEEQDEGGHLVLGGGEEGVHEPIVLNDEEEEIVNSGQGGEARMELGEETAAAGEGESEVDEVNSGEIGAEGGQDKVSGFDVGVDVVAEEGVDESNTDLRCVEDAEDQVAVVEKKFFLLFGLNLAYSF